MKKFYVEPNVEYVELLTHDIMTGSITWGDGGTPGVGEGDMEDGVD